MMRTTTILLCILVAGAAAGRYRAETAVREAHDDLHRIKIEQVEEAKAGKMLRAEVAYLENPERLAKIARAKTDLRPTERGQSLSKAEFAVAMGIETPNLSPMRSQPSEVIANAIAMAQLGGQSSDVE